LGAQIAIASAPIFSKKQMGQMRQGENRFTGEARSKTSRFHNKTLMIRASKRMEPLLLYVLSDEEALYGQQNSTGHGICNKHILWSQHQKHRGVSSSHLKLT
jgi:hypothetical protein